VGKTELAKAIAGATGRELIRLQCYDLGRSLNNFNEDYMDTLNSGTTLIIVGDGRNNYNDPRPGIFSTMSRHATRTIWLNPEPPALWHGDSDMPKYAPLCNDVLKVSNLRELAEAVDDMMTGSQ
jgi:uncharacterized protein with von Willebrand factor type A (vWA) domain